MAELRFPKKQTRKRRHRHPHSILQEEKGYCYICGRIGYTEEHHIFSGANRIHSEEYGLKVYLCPFCHRISENSAHTCRETREYLRRKGQQAFEAKCGSRDNFVKVFGRNYL